MANQQNNGPHRTPNDEALIAAWQRFLEYNTASDRQKQVHSGIRTLIIVLALMVSTFAVFIIYTTPENAAKISIEPLRNVLPFLGSAFLISLIVLPVVAAALMSYALQFSPSTAWIAYRIGAELIRREIYLYRMQAGNYAKKSPNEQQMLLTQMIKEADKQVQEIGATAPFLRVKVEDLSARVKQHTDRPQKDDGFSALSSADYVQLRVEPQRDWYVNRSDGDYRKLKRWRIWVLGVTGITSIIAALDALAQRGGPSMLTIAPLAAVTTALAVAVTLYMDLKMYGQTYSIFHPTVIRLNYELNGWKIQPPEAQNNSDQVATFVAVIEAIFQEERWQWMKRAIQAHNAIEQTLVKNVADHTSLTFNERISSPSTDELFRILHANSPSGGKITETQTVTETVVMDKPAEQDSKTSIEVRSLETKREVVAAPQDEPPLNPEVPPHTDIAPTASKAANGKDHSTDLPDPDNGDSSVSNSASGTKSTSVSTTD